MIRTLAVLVAFACAGGVALPAAEAAPAPRPKKPPLYYPTTVGTKWVYTSRNDEWEKVVTKVEEKDGVYIVSTAIRDEDGKLEGKVAVSDQGLAAVEDGKVKFEGRALILKLPHKEGKIFFEEDDLGTYTVTQGKPRRLKVPAGEFDAIPVEHVRWIKGEPLSSQTYWYAPGVGLVKVGEAEGKGIVLKSFTPGKE